MLRSGKSSNPSNRLLPAANAELARRKSSKSGSAMGFDAGIQNNDWYFPKHLNFYRCCFRRSYPTTTHPMASMP